MDAAADVLLFLGQTEAAPGSAGGNDDSRSHETLTASGVNALLPALQVDSRHLAVVEYLHPILFKMCAQVRRQTCACGVRCGNEVGNVGCIVHLAANALGHHSHLEPFSRRIDCGSSSGWSASHNHHAAGVGGML